MAYEEEEDQLKSSDFSYWQRFRSELNPCQAYFSALDKPSGKVLDVPATFSPRSTLACGWKFANTLFNLGVLIYNWAVTNYPSFYLSYVTSWTLVVTVIYTVASGFHTLFPVDQPDGSHRLLFRTKIVWLFFVTASVNCAIVTLYYWALVWSPGDEVSFATVNPHGITMVLCWIDGLIVNRIPLRIMHWYGAVMLFQLAYVVWSVIHAVMGIGNPNVSVIGLFKEDEAIYTSLNWTEDPALAAAYSAGVIFVLGPIFFLLQWYFGSRGCCCCNKSNDRLRWLQGNVDGKAPDEEEGPTMAVSY